MKKVFIVSMVLLVCFSVSIAQEVQEKVTPEPPEMPEIRRWQLPAHMQEILISLLTKKVDEFRIYLVANVKGFEDMPSNVVFDFASGLFLTPEGVLALQEQQRKEAEKIKEEK